jgi:hypothetical protein
MDYVIRINKRKLMVCIKSVCTKFFPKTGLKELASSEYRANITSQKADNLSTITDPDKKGSDRLTLTSLTAFATSIVSLYVAM